MQCSDCKWSDMIYTPSLENLYYCKYNPPKFFGSKNDNFLDYMKWSYPIVHEHDFCRHFSE